MGQAVCHDIFPAEGSVENDSQAAAHSIVAGRCQVFLPLVNGRLFAEHTCITAVSRPCLSNHSNVDILQPDAVYPLMLGVPPTGAEMAYGADPLNLMQIILP